MGLLGGTLLTHMENAQAEVSIKTIDYHGWKDAYRLSNGTVEVIVVPQIGRIMHYGLVNGPNMLWNNADLAGKTTDLASGVKDWNNYGGDKLWPAPQSRWGWPPDPVIDSAPQKVKALPNHHLLMVGQASQTAGVRFEREIALEPTGTRVTLINTIINTGQKNGPATVDWGVWEVAQVDDPAEARLMLNKHGLFPDGFHILSDKPLLPEAFRRTDTQLILKRHPQTSAKVGGDAPEGVLEAIVKGFKFTVSTVHEAGAAYPDGGCAQEIYTSTDPAKYVELELLGPMQALKPDAARQFVTHWNLTKM